MNPPPPEKLKALIFDLDGTLVDTDALHFQAYRDVLAQSDIAIDKTLYDSQMMGRPNPEIVKEFFPQFTGDDVTKLIEAKEQRFRELAKKLEPIAGLNELLAWAKRNSVEVALVTSAVRPSAYFMLEAINLEHTFATRVFAEDLEVGKPDPLPYRVALQKLKLEADEVIVFEDSSAGVRSAVDAGIWTVGMLTTQTEKALKKVGASVVIRDFSDKSLWQRLR